MKYRIKNIYFSKGACKIKGLKSKRKRVMYLTVLPPALWEEGERINVSSLFSVGELPEAKMPSLLQRLLISLSVLFRRLSIAFSKAGSMLRAKAKEILLRPSHNRFYFGALCAAVTVAVLSASIVLLGLFSAFMRPYDRLVIPDLTGQSFSTTEKSLENKINFLVSYENSEITPAGEIISQTPSAGVTRRVYSGGKKPTVTVKVSLGRSFYSVDNFSGADLRTARLALLNAHVSVNEVYEFSDTVPSGQIISSTPVAGERLFTGETITLTVSLGKYVPKARVPDLYGLSESQARALLESRKLCVAKVNYAVSNSPAGTVISQDLSPYTDVAEGSTVTFTVSLGSSAAPKHVPDLYGLTVDQAKQKLREVGLVLGGIFTVSSAAPAGTVVTQGFAAGTPITSSITSIDIYISS
ncbi:MAG: PASTA domain-containing protein [Ruminococcaceae bacterium]|nr:PASTA domain-containing protein [Oscillospiraceae bacterium]